MKKIFISYSLKDSDMIKTIFKSLKFKLQLYNTFTYIDTLDTKISLTSNYLLSKIELNSNKIINKYQKELMKELFNL